MREYPATIPFRFNNTHPESSRDVAGGNMTFVSSSPFGDYCHFGPSFCLTILGAPIFLGFRLSWPWTVLAVGLRSGCHHPAQLMVGYASTWAVKSLAKHGTALTALSLPGSFIAHVAEHDVDLLFADDETCELTPVQRLYMPAVILDACVVPPASVALLTHTHLTLFTLDSAGRVLAQRNDPVALPYAGTSQYAKPTRLMQSNHDGSLIAIASLESLLWFFSCRGPPFLVRLPGIPMAVSFTTPDVLIALVAVPDVNCCRAVVVDCGTSDVRVRTHSHCFMGDVLACLPLPARPSVVAVIDEVKVVLFDTVQGTPLSLFHMPRWATGGAEHRVAGPSPIVCAVSSRPVGGDHLVVSTESGLLYAIRVDDDEVDLVRLGVACPTRSIAWYSLPRAKLPGVVTTNATARVDVLYVPGDGCNGMSVAVLDWSATDCLVRLGCQHPCLSPITDHAMITPDCIAVASKLGKHGGVAIAGCGIGHRDCTERAVALGDDHERLIGLRRIWTLEQADQPVKTHRPDDTPCLVVCAFMQSTRVLVVDPEPSPIRIEDATEHWPVAQDTDTLDIAFVADGRLIQVHQKGMRIITADRTVHDWASPSPIVSASVAPSGLLALADYNCVALATVNDCNDQPVRVIGSVIATKSVVTTLQLLDGSQAQGQPGRMCSAAVSGSYGASPLIVTGCSDGSIGLCLAEGDGKGGFAIRPVVTLCGPANRSSSPEIGIESVCVMESDRHQRLSVVAGLRDGTLVRYTLKEHLTTLREGQGADALYDVHVIPFGCAPVRLVWLGPDAVMALSDTVAMLKAGSGTNVTFGKLSRTPGDPSVVNVTCAARFDQRRVVVATDTGIRVIQVAAYPPGWAPGFAVATLPDEVPLQSTPRRILHHASSGYLVVSCSDLVDGVKRSSLYLVDVERSTKISFGSFEAMETVQALIVWPTTTFGDLLVVGSACTSAVRGGPGRIRCYSIIVTDRDGDDSADSGILRSGCAPIRLVLEASMPAGPCLALSTIDSKLIATAGPQLHILDIVDSALHSMCHYASRDMILHADCLGLNLAICDERVGLQILCYDPDHSRLRVVSSDPAPRLTARAAFVDGNTCLASDKFGAVFVVTNRLPDDVQRPASSLITVATFDLGETVSKITRRGDGFILSTLSGSLFAVGSVSDSDGELMQRMQSQLLPPVRSTRVVDLDIIRAFLEGSLASRCDLLKDSPASAMDAYHALERVERQLIR